MRRLTRRRALLAACTTMSLAATGAASAEAACSSTATTKAFAKLGDSADYSLLSGASFETGAAGWTLSGASIVTGNESLMLGGARDARSLRVTAKGRVISPKFCVGIEHPSFRFVARQASGSWATLLVKLRWTDSRGGVNETTLGSLDGGGYGRWTATPKLALATSLPLWQSGQSVTAQIVLDPEDYGGDWQVDDIYIDPYRRS